MLLHEIVEFAARASPEDPALVCDGRRLNFSEFNSTIETMAKQVAALTKRDDRVVVISENSVPMATAMYALPMAGVIAAFGNTRHTTAELIQLVAVTDPALVLASSPQLERLDGDPSWRDLTRATRPLDRSTETSPGLPPPVIALTFDDLSVTAARSRSNETRGIGQTEPGYSPESESESAGSATDPESCAWLIHTSGTTGRPKGAMLSHKNLLAAVLNTAVARPLSDDDIYLFPFPLFHVAAYNVLHAHLRRRPVVLTGGFDAEEALTVIEAERITNCSFAPTMLAMILDHPAREHTDLSSLRQVSYGAAAMPLDLLLRMGEELPGCGLAQGYGMTELSGNAVFLDPAAHRRAATSDPHLLSAAGRPGPLVSVRIVDDVGEDVAPGESGEIVVAGDQVLTGYWRDPVETEPSHFGEWFRTGDIGRIDQDGFIYIVDRKKDIIISGGENVASREIEDLLSTHPLVAQAAVIGMPDTRWGEVVTAVVVPSVDAHRAGAHRLDPRAVVEWTEGRVAGFKRPRRVFTAGTLPVNASGKVDKVALRKAAAKAWSATDGALSVELDL